MTVPQLQSPAALTAAAELSVVPLAHPKASQMFPEKALITEHSSPVL